MSVKAAPERNLPVITGGAPPLWTVRLCPHWSILDGDVAMFGLVVHDGRTDVEVYAERVAELLRRHGLVDVDDTIEGVTHD